MLRKIGISLLVLILLVTGLLVGWYRIDGQPMPETEQFLSGAGYTVEQRDDGGLVFRPAKPNRRGIVIMHGALIKPMSYASSAAYFARRGYLVVLPYGGFWRLPVNAVNDTAKRLSQLDADQWFLIGHSMGGLASLELLRESRVDVRAVALWGSGIPFDFKGVSTPLLFLWGDRDGILNAERLEGAKGRLPRATRYVTLAGGNHRNFAMYTHQFFDNDGPLYWREQLDQANALTAEFFDSHAD
ncbi:MAG: alpha/beta hydrolase [Gammaproteobacteria bacterium]